MTKRHAKTGENLPSDREKIDKANKVVDELLETKAYQEETLKRHETQLAKLKVTTASLQEAVAWRESQIRALNKSEDYLKAEIAQLERAIASNGEALNWRGEQVEELERKVVAIAELERKLISREETLMLRGEQVEQLKRDVEYLQGQLAAISGQLREVSSHLEDTLASPGWKFVLWVRQIKYRILPEGTERHAAYEKLMIRVRSRLGG